MISSGLNSIDPCRHVKSYASAELGLGMMSSGLNSIDPCRHVKSYASAELSLGMMSSGLNSIDPGRHVKSYAPAELEFGHDVIGTVVRQRRSARAHHFSSGARDI
uniref:Orf-145 protein n=1 Tax=Lymantria dispar multicapsid nuclear polyhedrosis virus TaxID=10449 RepID=A0A140IL56_NPVLD|nr:Orf-145 protein [Lymantria dispar multiple nucleopolyhedrovirus]